MQRHIEHVRWEPRGGAPRLYTCVRDGGGASGADLWRQEVGESEAEVGTEGVDEHAATRVTGVQHQGTNHEVEGVEDDLRHPSQRVSLPHTAWGDTGCHDAHLPEGDHHQLARRRLAQHSAEGDEHGASAEQTLDHERHGDSLPVHTVAGLDVLPERGSLVVARRRGGAERRTGPAAPPASERRTNMFHRNTKAAIMKL